MPDISDLACHERSTEMAVLDCRAMEMTWPEERPLRPKTVITGCNEFVTRPRVFSVT